MCFIRWALFGLIFRGLVVGYLSLVVLCIEEGVVARHFDDLKGMVIGFMNDSQVEKPVVEGGREKRLVKIVLSKKNK